MLFSVFRNKNLLFERKKHRQHDEDEGNDVVPTECVVLTCLQDGHDKDRENSQWNGFLDHF